MTFFRLPIDRSRLRLCSYALRTRRIASPAPELGPPREAERRGWPGAAPYSSALLMEIDK